MCGIAGFLNTRKDRSAEYLKGVATSMSHALKHRGPDSSAIWLDESEGLALAHCRLAILDLSQNGAQPMISASGRYVITLNGEIYNFGDLRKQLENLGHRFRGHSDTEVLLAAFDQWGVHRAVSAAVGMFAFAVWDRHDKSLLLARDRLGEKPLYYGWSGASFLFASELKAIREYPDFRAEIDRNALAAYLGHGYVPSPLSIYRGVTKLAPGVILELAQDQRIRLHPYWCAKTAAQNGIANPFQGSEREAIDELNRLLSCAVRHQMVADVPLGAFLSGGIDSTAVVAHMQRASSRPAKTFTVGFEEGQYDEAEHARKIATHLGTDHTQIGLTSRAALDVIPKISSIYDEPFADASQIPTFLVSELARRSVTVSLSGDGGDELFGGYTHYLAAQNLWRQVKWVPAGMRRSLARGLRFASATTLDRAFFWASPIFNRYGRAGRPSHKLRRIGELLQSETREELYAAMLLHWKPDENPVSGYEELSTPFTASQHGAEFSQYLSKMMYIDTVTFLPDDILVKVDRAAMAVSLETRVPLLDHRIFEFAWRIPVSMKLRAGSGKWLLKQALFDLVPRRLLERPKSGFGVPIAQWLRGPLREWAESLLDERALREDGFLDPVPIRRKWREHVAGEQNCEHQLWSVLMFQGWLQTQQVSCHS